MYNEIKDERRAMMSELNVNVFAFADEADSMIDGQIEALKRNNLKGIEIRNVDGVNISDITLEKAGEVKKKLEDNGFYVWSLGSPLGKINIKDEFEPHLEKFKQSLKIAKELGCENIRMFSFYMPEGEDPTIYKEEVFERLARFIEAAEGSGINLCHENEKGIYGDIPERCLEIHKAFPQIKGIFDPANYVQCGADTLEGWDMLKDYIYYLHIKDSMKNGFVVPAGEGDGNVEFIIKDYVKSGGKSITIEPHLTVFEGLKELEREGEESAVADFKYPDAATAFDAACNAVNKIFGR